MRFISTLLLLSIVILFSCRKENLPDDHDEHPEINKNFVDLIGQNASTSSFNLETGAAVIAFSGAAQNLEEGSIISLDLDTMGYLRKVTACEVDGQQAKIQTIEATIDEVFINKEFKLHSGQYKPQMKSSSDLTTEELSALLTDEHGFIHPVRSIKTNGEGATVIWDQQQTPSELKNEQERFQAIDIPFKLPSVDLYGTKDDPVWFRLLEPDFQATADVVIEFDFKEHVVLDKDDEIKLGDLKKFSMYVDGNVNATVKWELEVKQELKMEKTKKLMEVGVVTHKFLVGLAPVWVKYDCDLYGSFSVTTKAKVSANWGMHSNHNVKLGGIIRPSLDNLFESIAEYTGDTGYEPLIFTGEVNLEAKAELYPKLEILIYDKFGPTIDIVPFTNTEYNTKVQQILGGKTTKTFDTSINVGLDGRVAAKIEFVTLMYTWTKETEPFEFNLFKTPLWFAPDSIHLVSEIPESASPGQTVEVFFQVVDSRGNPWELCPVHLETGSGLNDIFMTDFEGMVGVNWILLPDEGLNTLWARIYNSELKLLHFQKIEIVTEDKGSPPIVTTDRASEIGKNSVRLHGTVTSDEGLSILSRGFYYSKDSKDPGPSDQRVEVPGGVGQYEILVENLKEAEGYYFRAFATNAAGTSLGDILSFVTEHGGGVPVVMTEPASDLTSTSAILHATVFTDNGAPIIQRGFYYSATNKTPDENDNKITTPGTTGSYQAEVIELEPGTTYYYNSFATNINGTSVGIIAGSFETLVVPDGYFDYQGQSYGYKIIGTQTWMAENLNYTSGNSWCYENQSTNCETYGRLYDLETAKQVCPPGWHLPSDEEWGELIDFLGSQPGTQMRSREGWYNQGNGNNKSGFNALPGGYYRDHTDSFEKITESAMFWSSTIWVTGTQSSWARRLNANLGSVQRAYFDNTSGLSVRCVK